MGGLRGAGPAERGGVGVPRGGPARGGAREGGPRRPGGGGGPALGPPGGGAGGEAGAPVEADLVRGRSRSGRTSSSRGRGVEPELLEGRPLSMEPLGENRPPGSFQRGGAGEGPQGSGGGGQRTSSRGGLAVKQSSAHFKEFGAPSVAGHHLHARPWNSPAGADVPGGLMRRLPGALSLKSSLEPEVRVDPVLRVGLRPRSQLLALKNGTLKKRSTDVGAEEPTLYGPRSRAPKPVKPVHLVLGGSACEMAEPAPPGRGARGPAREPPLSFTTHLPTACTTGSGKKPAPPKEAPLGLYPLYSSLQDDRR